MPSDKRIIRSNLEKIDRHEITSEEYEEAPELTEEQLAAAVLKESDQDKQRRS